VGENSGIEWTHHTFNPWTGCTRVSPGCDHCYAAAFARRNPSTFGSWEPGAPRKRTSPRNWYQPIIWNRRAAEAGERHRVFCASMADVFDNQAPEAWRLDLWELIHRTPHLDWLLLTKRPQNMARMLPQPATLGFPAWGQGWPNVWLGTTAENQAEADRRIPHLLAVPAATRFLSCEPLLGPVDLSAWWKNNVPCGSYWHPNGLNWVIVGGESGPEARPSHPDWFRSLRDQCAAAGVPFFFKQWGVWTGRPINADGFADHLICIDAAGRHFALSRSADDVAKGAPWWRLLPGAGFWAPGPIPAGAIEVQRAGKKAAGAHLDGREHREVPGA
jgi:protein gp37